MERSISFIMSAYNEERGIGAAVKTVVAKLENYKFDYEIFIFNDGSTDRTGEIAEELAAENSRIKVFHNSENMNLGFNFLRGIKLVSKMFVGLLPCHNLIASESYDNILRAFEKYQKDIIVAYIDNPQVRPLSRRFVSRFNTVLLNLLFGFGLRYYHLNFYRAALLKRLPKSTNSSYALMVELLVYALASGASYVEVPFFRLERGIGKSKALRFKNISDILKTYAHLFWQVRVLKKKVEWGNVSDA